MYLLIDADKVPSDGLINGLQMFFFSKLNVFTIFINLCGYSSFKSDML